RAAPYARMPASDGACRCSTKGSSAGRRPSRITPPSDAAPGGSSRPGRSRIFPPTRPTSGPRHARTASFCAPKWRCTVSPKSWTISSDSSNPSPRPRLRLPLPPPSARRSVTRRAALRGTGLHTGATTEATFLPAPAGQGIVFRRVDLAGTPEVPARLTEVEAVERRTAIGHGAATIHTVEHLLAAVAAHLIDDLTIELTGPEPPILDGSVQPYFDALAKAEPTSVGCEPAVLTVTAPFTVTDKDAAYVVAPAKTFRLTVSIEWPHPLIGRQAGAYEVTPSNFAAELAPARTFGFTHEVAELQARGLIKGASPGNAIVLDERGVVNGGKLRWPDEFVRHKAADIVGDLALTGARIQAHVVATRPSHGGNI